ncbi:MAG: carbon monoxide dehydrogenase [Alphaproteobacteria bacterium]|nr:MAG: carbon monoxide dehydrogenase [Alphaproteobacteria bacterium]
MKLEGETVVPAPRQVVWDALNDETVLIACIPGCEALERISDNELAAVGHAKVGPVEAKLKGEVRLENIVPPLSYTLIGQGKGAVGFVRARADVALHEEDGGRATRIDYSLEAKIGGRLAQVGSRLMTSAARKYADDFFACFSQRVAERAGAAAVPAGEEVAREAAGAAVETTGGAAGETHEAEQAPGGLPVWAWAGGLILLVLALLYWLA